MSCIIHENQGPRFGENYIIAKQRKRDQPICVVSVIAENKPHAHYEIHLHTVKVVNNFGLAYYLVFTQKTTKKETPAFLESRYPKASSTY